MNDDTIIRKRDLRERLQIHPDTLRRWLRDKKLPEPDVRMSLKTTGWKRSTLEAAGLKLW